MKVFPGEKVENDGGGLPWILPWGSRGTFSPQMWFSLIYWKEHWTGNWLA